MKSSENNSPMSIVQFAKMFGRKVNTWAKVRGLAYIPCPSDCSMTVVSNARILQYENEINLLKTSMLNDTDKFIGDLDAQ